MLDFPELLLPRKRVIGANSILSVSFQPLKFWILNYLIITAAPSNELIILYHSFLPLDTPHCLVPADIAGFEAEGLLFAGDGAIPILSCLLPVADDEA